MTRTQVRNYHSDKQIPPRVFDAVVDGDNVTIEVKFRKTIVTIPWEDVKYQVNQAIETEKKKHSSK